MKAAEPSGRLSGAQQLSGPVMPPSCEAEAIQFGGLADRGGDFAGDRQVAIVNPGFLP